MSANNESFFDGPVSVLASRHELKKMPGTKRSLASKHGWFVRTILIAVVVVVVVPFVPVFLFFEEGTARVFAFASKWSVLVLWQIHARQRLACVFYYVNPTE